MEIPQSECLNLYNTLVKDEVKNYYRKYKTYYKSLSLDFKDIQQEILVLILELIKKYKDKAIDEQKAIIVKATERKLLNIITSAVNTKIDIVDDISSFTTNNRLTTEEILNKLKEELTEIQYQVIYKSYIENFSITTISNLLFKLSTVSRNQNSSFYFM
jgi:DNA-directed RNA polymerase specialized sigma24 family protein